MQKDSSGHVGFRYKNGKITDLVKDSSAARNGLLTDHQMCEINGQNVVGMKVHIFWIFSKNRVNLAISFQCGNFWNWKEQVNLLLNLSTPVNSPVYGPYDMGSKHKDIFKDKQIGEVLKSAGSTLTVTVMPEFIYDHIVKKVSKGLFKQMDHSIPDV